MIKANLGLWPAQNIKHGMVEAKLPKGETIENSWRTWITPASTLVPDPLSTLDQVSFTLRYTLPDEFGSTAVGLAFLPNSLVDVSFRPMLG